MGEIQRIADELRREYAGDPWHGSSTHAILEDLTAAQAASRPARNAHTIWEIVLHLTAWTREVCRRVRGGKPQVPAEGDWPAVGSTGEAAWSDVRAALAAAHEELLDALRSFDESSLHDVVGEGSDAAAGTGVSFYFMLHGLAQHDAYHSGQIGLLKKAVAGTR